MSNIEIMPMSHGQFLQEFTENIGRAERARLFAMQLEVTPHDADDSVLVAALHALIRASRVGVDAKLVLDARYTRSMTRVNERDYPNWWPLLDTDEREMRRENAALTHRWLSKLIGAGVLEPITPRVQSGSHATFGRVLASRHAGQHWATVHQKGGVILHKDPNQSFTTLTSGNLTSSDVEMMNNLALRFNKSRGHAMGEFVARLLVPGVRLRSAGGHTWSNEEADFVTVLHDYNNVGDPARLPFIHIAAEKMIDPARDEHVIDGLFETKKPTDIVYISQYFPDGKLAVMLNHASDSGARVTVPAQPAGDYRRSALPYNIQVAQSKIDKAHITFLDRQRRSHVKSLVVKYDDGSATILSGSDNYLTNLQKFVRNEELAVLLRISPDSPDQVAVYMSYIDTLLTMGEIDTDTHDRLAIK